MSRDEITRMALAAGFVQHYTRPQDAIVRKGYALSGELKGYKAAMQDIERFFHAAYAAGAAAEREACAKVCEEDAFVDQWKGLSEAVKRIRARSQQ